LMGGRTAEELIFQDPTTGAQNDIERASQIARSMVTEFGMSDAIGPQQLGHKNGEVFLGRELGHQANYSDEVAARIDSEVRRLIDEAHVLVADMYAEIFSGIQDCPDRHLATTFEAGHDEMVMVRDIPLYGVCEHHLIPFVGKAHVAYIPNQDGRITGLSKLARLVDTLSKRP